MKTLADVPLDKQVGQRVALATSAVGDYKWGTVVRAFVNSFGQREATVHFDDGEKTTHLVERLSVYHWKS